MFCGTECYRKGMVYEFETFYAFILPSPNWEGLSAAGCIFGVGAFLL